MRCIIVLPTNLPILCAVGTCSFSHSAAGRSLSWGAQSPGYTDTHSKNGRSDICVLKKRYCLGGNLLLPCDYHRSYWA